MRSIVRYRALGAASVCLTVVALLLPAAPSRAQEGASGTAPGAPTQGANPASEPSAEQLREARALFQLAHAHYDAGRYAEAAVELERALQLAPRPQLYLDLHLAYREMGDTERSADALRHYLAEYAAMEPEQRVTLERRLLALERTLAERASDPTATPAEPTAEPAPETHDGMETDAASRAEADARAASSEVGSAEEPSTSDGGGDGLPLAPGVIALTVGALALVGAAIAGGVALGTVASRDAMCTLTATGAPGGTECPASLDQAAFASRFELERGVAWGLLGGGAGIVIVGAVLTALAASDDAPDQESAGTLVTASCTGDGCVGILAGTF